MMQIMRRDRIDTIAYTLEDAAEVVGLSRESIYRAVKSGELPAKRTSKRADGRPSGRILVLRRDLEAFIENLPDDWWGHYY